MNLYLMRHGIAEELGQGRSRKDSDRRLTREGEEKTLEAAKAMKRLGLSFDAVLSSPYIRARRTAEIICEGLGLRKPVELTGSLAPGENLRGLVEEVGKRKADSVLIVGHEPGLSELISLLVSGNRGLALAMKKGGLCKLGVEALHYGRCATLEWLVTPKQLAAMA